MRRIWGQVEPFRVLGYGSLALMIAVLFGLEQFAAPCPDLLDGPCEHNWASDAQWMVLSLFLAAMIVSLCLAVWLHRRRCRARRRRHRLTEDTPRR